MVLGVIAAFVAAPLFAQAQQPGKVWSIGYLTPFPLTDPRVEAAVNAFKQGLRDLGYVEGRNVVIESRTANHRYEDLPKLASELVQPGWTSSLWRRERRRSPRSA